MKKIYSFLLLGLLLSIGNVWAETANLAYTGNTTTNMTGNNDAALVSLDDSEWSVVAAKGGNNNFPGLNKAPDIRLYYSANGSNTITVTSLNNSIISTISVYYMAGYSNGKVLVDDVEVDGSFSGNTGVYNINSSSFVITNGNTSNIQVRFNAIVIEYSSSSTPSPTISASNVNIEYGDTEGSITYSVSNPVEGGAISAAITAGNEGSWLTLGQETTSPISFTCSANEGSARTAIVTLTYTYNNNETITKNVTITQAAGPIVYSTIADLFSAATASATDVHITFGNWVVSGVSTNGKNVFVTDGTNGFVIFNNGGGLGNLYAAGDILSGTDISCKLQLYNGFAELTNLDASDLTIQDGGIVVAANISMADLAGINTGALVHYDNLTCSINNNKYYLSDGTTTLQVFNSLFAFDALEAGKTYNITGVYQQYNSTKEILPRSAADIEEVVSLEASITLSSNSIEAPAEGIEDGEITVTYNNISTVVAELIFCDAQGIAVQEEYDWIVAGLNESNNIVYTIAANDGDAPRTAYMKVSAFDDNSDIIYSDLITISQAAPVIEYATLPFAFDGGRADIATTNGLTQEGLGNDYGSGAPKLKFDGTGDYLILEFNDEATLLTFDIKGNSFSGGTFKVQTSADGTIYDDMAIYTSLAGSAVNMFVNINPGVRFIKWIYTEKAQGNVGLGNIELVNNGTHRIEISTIGYATYYNSTTAYFMPEGCTGYAFTAEVGLVVDAPYAAGEDVPADEPLIITGEPGVYYLTFTTSQCSRYAELGWNDLLGTDVAEQIADDGTSNYYALQTDANGENVGFYWMATEDDVRGKAFVNGAHKAYLKLGNVDAPSRIIFNENYATNINNLKDSESVQKFFENGQVRILREGVVYDATGRVVR